MKFSSLAFLCAAVVFCVLICGCGDTFRPVATPLPLPSPNPQAARLAVFTSCQVDPVTGDCSRDPKAVPGASTDIDVSGDSLVGVTPVGRSPVNALVETAEVVTADRDSDTITSYTRVTSGTIGPPTTTGLPTGAGPTSLVNANNVVYVTESGRNVLAVLGVSFAISAEIPVGITPVDSTVLPNGKKIYVVNHGDNSVTVIDTSNNSVVTTVSDPNASSPVWAVPSADSSHVFVINQGSSNVSVINATNDTIVATLPIGNSPNYAVFDTQNQRVIVTNPGNGISQGSVSVINADPTSPLFETVTNIPVGINPRSVTALANGTRVYVTNTGSNSISVINSLSLSVSKTITVGTAPISIASDGESQKVYAANRDSHDVSIINTSTDTEVSDLSGHPLRIKAPVDQTCTPTATTTCTQLSPIFVAVGPG